MKAKFLRLGTTAEKESTLASAVAAINRGDRPECLFEVDPTSFARIPGGPLAYWMGDALRNLFVDARSFRNDERIAINGLTTCDDFRFVRGRWEVGSTVPFARGGASARFHLDLSFGIRWRNEGRELKASIETMGDHWTRYVRNPDYFGHPGITWPLRSARFSPQARPEGSIFSVRGYSAIVPTTELPVTLAIFSSSAFDWLMKVSLGRSDFPEFVVGVVERTPWPTANGEVAVQLSTLAHRAWSLKRSLDTTTETSHALHLPALLQVRGATLSARAGSWSAHVSHVEAELATIQAEIDDIAFRLYGIDGEDRARIESESGTTPTPEATDDDADATDEPDDAEPDDEDDTSSADTTTLATELLSWSIGVAFGRFDLRLATGERPAPAEPGPFDPLPTRSPGICPDDALAVEFLVDDPGHPLDLGARIAGVSARVFPTDGEARLDEAVHLAGSPDLSTFLRRTFFPFHLKRYSKSRRKAPIWWPLSTASGTYTVWLAWPRLTRDTLFRVADEIKRQKLPFENRKLASLKQEHGPNPTTRQRADIAAQEDFVSELTALLEEVERVAPMWNPVHDDGVILHYALLWRVVRDATWQKECRAAWDKLAKGDYDWAHIAMHLWPERVAPKCRTDRSLAIAHGLEDTFWVEIAGKWRARDNTDAALADAIAARTSPAVKAALRAFTDAPAPGRAGRGKKGA